MSLQRGPPGGVVGAAYLNARHALPEAPSSPGPGGEHRGESAQLRESAGISVWH